MKLPKRNTMTALLLTMAMSLTAGLLEQGKQQYSDGDYEAAAETLRAAVRRTPRDGNANYYLGLTLTALGNNAEARTYLEKAAGRGITDAYLLLVEQDIASYDPDAASEHLEAWRTRLKRNRKSAPEQMETLASRVVKMRNMLVRVEQIEVVDSMDVPSKDFFAAYRLSSSAGRILPPLSVSRLIGHGDSEHTGVAFVPQSHSEMLWSEADSSGVMQLYSAGILDDGTPEPSVLIDSSLSEGGSAAYPFLMPDGMTLYFANDGENSLGGYDIFMTRREHTGDGYTYYQPQNMGMPYNSPYNDYLLALDEESGLGWFASDRSQKPDTVTVYVFIPSDIRVNVDVDDPNLISLAKLSDISLTQKEGVDYAGKIAADSNNDEDTAASFMLDMGNGRIYTTLSDFRQPAARSAMIEYIGAQTELERQLQKEQVLRDRWRTGDHSVKADILDSERHTDYLRKNLKRLRNAVITAENR